MRLYKCDVSGLPLYFDSRFSVGAGNAPVGFVADSLTLHTLSEAGDGLWKIASRPGETWRFCANAPIDGSNWLVRAHDPNTLALPARYNRLIPNTDTPEGLANATCFIPFCVLAFLALEETLIRTVAWSSIFWKMVSLWAETSQLR